MENSDWALVISGFSVAIAIAGFVWNIWQRFIFVRPTLQASFQVAKIFQGGKWGKQLCCIHVTNMGPGPAILHNCVVKQRGERLWHRARYGLLNPIHGNPNVDEPTSLGPFSGGLPCKIDSGEVKSFYFPFDTKTQFLDESLRQVGVSDTYGRNSWCKRRDVRKVLKKFKEQFTKDASEYGAW